MELELGALEFLCAAVRLAASLAQGFGLADVAAVPWAWHIVDGSVSYFGWVVLLQDRRRVYLHYRVDRAKGAEIEGLRVQLLERRLSRPKLTDPGVHWVVPRHINRALGLPGYGIADRPEDLRDLAIRTRVIAMAAAEPEKSRLLAYANGLEATAAALKQERAVIAPAGVQRDSIE